MPDELHSTKKKYKVIGTRPIRHDGVDKVTGKALYGADVNLPGMLSGRILRSPHAHARILSIATSKAEAHPDVQAVLTNADFPLQENQSTTVIPGPPLNPKQQTDNILASDKVLYKGHPVAAVAAQSPHVAEEALALIAVEYEVLESVSTVEEALSGEAPRLHEEYENNIASHTQLRLGDLEQGFKSAHVIIERTYRTAFVHQSYLEPQVCCLLYTSPSPRDRG